MQLQQGKQTAKLNLLRKCGLLAHTSAAFLKNCCTEKLFISPAARILTTHLEKIFQEPFHKLQSLSTPQPNPTFHNSLFFSG